MHAQVVVLVIIAWFSNLAKGKDASSNNVRHGVLKKLMETQDRVCTLKYDENEGSYENLVETITGMNIPNFNSKYYTGFKLQRVYNLHLSKIKFQRSLRLTYCNNGKAQWIHDQVLDEDIHWESPICIHLPYAVARTKVPKYKIWTNNNKIQESNMETPIVINLKQTVENDISNFHCFKIARRNKYITRKYSLFFPGSWVGGIFFCDIDDESKRNVLARMNDDLTFKNIMEIPDCTLNNSIPLMPILSDDYGKNWIEVNNIMVRTGLGRTPHLELTKYVPYFNTPNYPSSSLDFILSNKKSSSVSVETWQRPLREQILEVFQKGRLINSSITPWYDEIEVQENYNLTSKDKASINSLMNKTIDTFSSMADHSNRAAKYFLSAPKNKRKTEMGDSDKILSKLVKRIEDKIWAKLNTLDKYITLIANNRRELESLASEWNNITIKTQTFKY